MLLKRECVEVSNLEYCITNLILMNVNLVDIVLATSVIRLT